jgi:hypothetical protein
MVNLEGELLAKAIKFRDPRLMFAAWFPQRHLVICVAEAKLRTTLVKTFVQPRTDCVRNSSARQLQRGDYAICMLQRRAMWSMPVSAYPGRVFHSTPSSLAISHCSQQVPFQNSSSMLVSCGPQCSARLLPKSPCSQKTPQRRSKCPNVSVRFCGASTILTKCASPSANGFRRLQSITRPKLALTQLCHLKVSRLSWFIL